jgi:hypothetical protein
MHSKLLIRSEKVARALVLGRAASYLQPFVARPASVAEASRRLAEPIQRVHYWVQNLLDLGLLSVDSVQPRAGRAIKYYRAAGASFLIPARLLPQGSFEKSEMENAATLRMAIETWQPALVHDGDILVSFDSNQGVNIDRLVSATVPAIKRPGGPAVVYTWMTLHLDREHADSLRAELENILQRYRSFSKPGSGARSHLLHIGLSPLT